MSVLFVSCFEVILEYLRQKTRQLSMFRLSVITSLPCKWVCLIHTALNEVRIHVDLCSIHFISHPLFTDLPLDSVFFWMHSFAISLFAPLFNVQCSKHRFHFQFDGAVYARKFMGSSMVKENFKTVLDVLLWRSAPQIFDVW